MRVLGFVTTLPALLLTAHLPGQAIDAAAQERELAKRASSALLALADSLAAQKQHARALELRREVILDYDSDHEGARAACGFVKIGGFWRRDDAKAPLDKDLRGDAAALRRLDLEATKLREQLGRDHAAVAAAFRAAGDADAAARHWRRVLRFKPGDAAALLALQPLAFEGFQGDAREIAMLRKSRAIRQAVAYLKKRPVEVTKLEGKKHPILDKAGLAHLGLAGRTFTAWGTLSEAKLKLAVEHAERCLSLCHTLFGTAGGSTFAPKRICNLLIVTTKAEYQKVIDTCASQFPADRLAFLREQVTLCFLQDGDETLRCFRTDGRDDFLLDQVVRGVIQDATKFAAHGLWEGIGHAACGFFFDRTLTFLVEQRVEHTVSGWKPKPLLPDMETWRKIASESAWSKSDTATSQLMFIHAAKFDAEQRVKAWAMLDYLLRWRPDLVLALESSKGEQQLTPPDVEAEFNRLTGVDLKKVDLEWRDHWAKGKPLRDAIAAEPKGDKDAVAGALAICDAVNDARVAAQRGPLGYTLAESPDARAALQWLEALARAEETKRKDPGQLTSLPSKPECIDRTVLAARTTDLPQAVARWVANPATRDLLLHPGRTLLPCARSKDAIVLDFTEPLAPTKQGLPFGWPGHHQSGVPSAVVVSELPPQLVAALAESGRKPTDLVGMPLSIHFARELHPNEIGGLVGRAEIGGFEIRAIQVCIQGNGDASEKAAGCAVLLPLEPLPPGKAVDVIWDMPRGVLERDQTFPKLTFTVQGPPK